MRSLITKKISHSPPIFSNLKNVGFSGRQINAFKYAKLMSYITHKNNILSDLVKFICHLPVMPPPGSATAVHIRWFSCSCRCFRCLILRRRHIAKIGWMGGPSWLTATTQRTKEEALPSTPKSSYGNTYFCRLVNESSYSKCRIWDMLASLDCVFSWFIIFAALQPLYGRRQAGFLPYHSKYLDLCVAEISGTRTICRCKIYYTVHTDFLSWKIDHLE